MSYLTMHSSYIYNYVRHMVKYHSDSEGGYLLQRTPFPWIFYMHHPTGFLTQVVEHWLDCETAQRVQHEGWI